MTHTWRLTLLLSLLTLSACVSQTIKSSSVPPLRGASVEVPENQLLDVGVAVFDPGLEDYDDDRTIHPEVRKAEARYMPTVLADAMQNSGAWGAVRVVPEDNPYTDLQVRGTIEHSDGEELELRIVARDARGHTWLDKTYRGQASRYAYQPSSAGGYDPFQAVYHTIANDLVMAQEQLSASERERIRLVSELLFAQSFSPDAFAGYLQTNRKGTLDVQRLPAQDDPMLARIRTIQEREHMFVDTLQGYYGSFNEQMLGPYQLWRKQTFEEAMALRELKRESALRMMAGIVSVAAGIAAKNQAQQDRDKERRDGDNRNSGAKNAAGDVAIIGGGYLLKSAFEKRAEAQIHVEALEELGLSLEAEITPQIIELDDRTVTLSGNVEQQYQQWRDLLADIYAAEIGELAIPPATTDS